MKKLILYASLICIGMASCSKDFLVDEEKMPEWLGESIYGELKNPKSLQGTFNTYIRLIDDLGYAEVLGKTGSKTIFPANDAAFAEYFKDGNNRYGVTSYEQLTYNQKAQLLYTSMLDNAILIGDISTEKSGDTYLQGRAVKHQTNIQLTNSIEPLYSQNFPKNNKFFDRFVEKGGLLALYDNTRAPIVHLTGEYMLNNAMTVVGENNDFSIITGEEYSDGDAYIFNHKVIGGNVTCQNGYIHQVDGVLDAPGNMAQMLRGNTESGSGTSFFSRMLDYYCAPFKDLETKNKYNAWAIENGEAPIEDVYSIRYFSRNSQARPLDRYTEDDGTNSNVHGANQLLSFDPGWNYYNPSTNGSVSNNAEIAAIFAPTDDALWNYFKENGGGGAYIIRNLGNSALENTRENLGENLDAIYNSDPSVFANMINNLMKPYFSKTVPSKFSTVQNDAFEFMNVTLDDVHKKDNGKFDVQIANNGVIYKMDKFYAPQLYNSVLGPASIYQNMRSMGQMLNDHSATAGEESKLGADMYYYLLSMKSKYAVFVPEDNSEFIYIDPTSIYDRSGVKALRFRFDATQSTSQFQVLVQKGSFVGGVFTELPEYTEENIEKNTFKTQIQDMLNYHTVILPSSENGLYGNHYYKTKHGGAIFIPDGYGYNGASVAGGAQVQHMSSVSTVKAQYSKTGRKDADPETNIENGTCYLLNTPIQPTLISTSRVLKNNFSKFKEFMDGFSDTRLLTFAGISDEERKSADGTISYGSDQTKYMMFAMSNDDPAYPALSDERMRMLSAYNYTLYAPTDDAMEIAYANGLPKWEEIENIVNSYPDVDDGTDPERKVASAKVRKMIDVMRSFVFYHIQNSSIFADNVIETGVYQTFCTDENGIARKLTIGGGAGTMTVKDRSGSIISIHYGDANANIMARDMVLKDNGRAIDYSSFVTIHGINKPLCFNTSGRFDDTLDK